MSITAGAVISHLEMTVKTHRFDNNSDEKDAKIKAEFGTTLANLKQHTVFSVPGEDSIKRSALVTMQRMIETLIAEREVIGKAEAGQNSQSGIATSKTPDQPSPLTDTSSEITKADTASKETSPKLKEVTIKYYTRLPPTPLCQKPAGQPSELASADMQHDEARLKTITDRKITVRELAKKEGNVNMHLIYLKGGLQPAKDETDTTHRSQQQLDAFQEELDLPGNANLINTPLEHEEMHDEIVGATYLLKDTEDQEIFFGLNSAQAIDADKPALPWRVWLGNPLDPEIQSRISELDHYVKTGEYINTTATKAP
ncbi:hypothetical protein [Endozoicomonas atrinae]|uniref:hypothetical protein n=1 Tax=Endozoicomonas atrinae TaxID=1333660 RepID=UPI0008250D8C|nr:hypothetical protein [Endozoicomonas atrinae]